MFRKILKINSKYSCDGVLYTQNQLEGLFRYWGLPKKAVLDLFKELDIDGETSIVGTVNSFVSIDKVKMEIMGRTGCEIKLISKSDLGLSLIIEVLFWYSSIRRISLFVPLEGGYYSIPNTFEYNDKQYLLSYAGIHLFRESVKYWKINE